MSAFTFAPAASHHTEAVVGLCNHFRETGDLACLPILADALDDAGYAVQGVTAELRRDQTAASGRRLVCLVVGGEYAAAVAWLTTLAEMLDPGYGPASVGMTCDELVTALLRFRRTGEPHVFYGIPPRMNDDPRELWRQFHLVVGVPPPKRPSGRFGAYDATYNPFECEC